MAPHVVVLGAGFAGIQCARRLVGEPVDVTLVDRNNFSTFQPLLYQVATAGLTETDVAYPVRGTFHDATNVRVRTGEVRGVDLDAQVVQLADGELAYDHLVLALGATTNWFGIDGAEEHALPLTTLADAEAIRDHVLGRFEAADAHPELVEEGALTVVVAGGGPTGVEMAGSLSELFSMVLAKDFPQLPRGRVVLVEVLPEVLGPFSARARRHAGRVLESRGVELRLGHALESVDAGGVRLDSGEVIPAQTVVFAIGVRANDLAGELGLEQTKGGRIVVGPDQRPPGRPNVWVAGDLAATVRGDGLLPQQAQPAKQTGRFIGAQIAALAGGGSVGRFRYKDLGSMATIGRRSAVADLPGRVRLTGTIGWVAWLFLHLLQLSGVRNRANVLVNWVWSYLFYDRGPRIIDPRSRRPGSPS